EESKNLAEAVAHIDKRLVPFKKLFIREVETEDIERLMEIKMGRILRFNSDKADQHIANLHEQLEKVIHHLAHIVEYTVNWFIALKEKYGQLYPRKTEIRNFDSIEATKVVEANQKLYINREEGFIGTSLKKDEFVCNCSDIDDVILFYKDGKYKITKVAEKLYAGKNVLYINVFKRNDDRTIYNVVYRNGKDGVSYIKRFAISGITRDKEYDVTKGEAGSKVLYFSANPNGEAEVLKVTLKPKPRLKTLVFERNFCDIAIKGRSSMGNIFTKNDIHKIVLKQKGGSTLGGREVWFDRDVLRLNYDGRGVSLGEFDSDECILVLSKDGSFYTTNFELSNHFEDNLLLVEKFDEDKIWSAVLYDADQQFYYVKRFTLEPTPKKTSFIGENSNSRLLSLSTQIYPRLQLLFGGKDAEKEALEIDVEEFIGVKSYKAKGKRLTTLEIKDIVELEPIRFPEITEDEPELSAENEEIEEDTSVVTEEIEPIDRKKIIEDITGQMSLF
ncbi:MAG: DNA gyrase/topoisomerase IV subunit A, partial [Paludibacter sp.]|nr:DNA gyrase/topoisomerase IV subunit A [Paludibacter sp.]